MFVRQRTVCLKYIYEKSGKMFESNLATERIQLETKSLLETIFLSAVQSVMPQKLIRNSIKLECDRLIVGHKAFTLKNNVHLVGFGKAVLGMASETEKILKDHLKSGILCLPKNTMSTFQNNKDFQLNEKSVIKIYEGASNNLPDEDAMNGAKAVVEKIKSLASNDILIVLISGGGSALLPVPKEGLTLEDKLNAVVLLASQGATINELNVLRKKLSEVKGGGLALLSYPRTTISLILSDVVNDPLDIIASGPTVPDSAKDTEAIDVLKKYNLLKMVPDNIHKILKEKVEQNPCIPVSSKGFFHVENFLVGNNVIALKEAKNCAEKLGFRTIILSNAIDSPVHTIGDFYIDLSFEICKALYSNKWDDFISRINYLLRTCHYKFPSSLAQDLLDCMKLQGFCKGICIIVGGETTVQVRGNGVGGRNQELALMVSQKLHKLKQVNAMYFKNFDITFLSAGTDGIDGNSDAAGAVGCADIITRALDNFIDPGSYLINNDSNSFFRIANKGAFLITTGHTGTNVMDLHILAITDLTQVDSCT